MDILPSVNIFRELQDIHDTGYFSAQPSLDDHWQQVSQQHSFKNLFSYLYMPTYQVTRTEYQSRGTGCVNQVYYFTTNDNNQCNLPLTYKSPPQFSHTYYFCVYNKSIDNNLYLLVHSNKTQQMGTVPSMFIFSISRKTPVQVPVCTDCFY